MARQPSQLMENPVAESTFSKTQPGIFSVDDLADIGVDDGTPVVDYGTSSRFTGTIKAED
ncbi:MAG: hypothetical protein IPP80_09655 [Ignavibacteria bacterium]|nr:hypothetical protein [Ignavibacteria bacterium]